MKFELVKGLWANRKWGFGGAPLFEHEMGKFNVDLLLFIFTRTTQVLEIFLLAVLYQILDISPILRTS